MPRRSLGGSFHRLWSANTATNVGDGVQLAAGPLLLATLTSDPGLVAGAVFVQQLPWLLFALPAGVVIDRLDRRRLLVTVNVLRCVVGAGLTAAVATGAASVPIVYLALFLLGSLETIADSAAQAVLPAIVAQEDLSRANSRIVSMQLVANQLVAPPLGALLFVAAAAVPFGLTAAAFLVAALLIAWIRIGPPATPPPPHRPLRQDLGTGLRAVLGHPVLRLMALSLVLMNVTLLGAFAVLVLYVRERLGTGELGFGLLLGSTAVGGIVGSLVVTRLQERFGPSLLLRIGLVIETATHLVMALTTHLWVAVVTFVVFGLHSAIWSVLTLTWRQRLVPDALRGRVGSAYFLFVIGGAALGALGGGLVARAFGITAPFWVSFVVMALFTVFAGPLFSRSRLDEPEPLPAGP